MNVADKELCAELYELSGWENNAGTRPDDRLKLWQQSYSTWEMGQGNPDYETTQPEQRRGIDIGEWRVVEDMRYMLVVASITHNPSHWYDGEVQKLIDASIPAYDLGYVLRKLPAIITDKRQGWTLGSSKIDDSRYSAYYENDHAQIYGYEADGTMLYSVADTPENAVVKLAIELFKQKVLAHE